MTRARLRSLPVLLLAGFGWALWPLVIGPAIVSVLNVRVQIGAQPGPWCVSTSGTLHGPDSPHRAMVPASRCHQTRAAAEAAQQE